MNSPCYDTIKHIDCPDRKAGCAVNCPKWAAYVKARDEEYKAKQAQRAVDGVLIKGAARYREYAAKAKMPSRRRH